MPTSALVVLVPEAEEVVGRLRARYDPSAALGVPAHVTVLYPFATAVDEIPGDRIASICRRQPPFAAEFATVERFPGLVVWLRPQPSAPFATLIAAAMAQFPDLPPYGGAIADPKPHLTVADGVDEATAALLHAQLGPGLPIRTRVEELTLLVEDGAGRWSVDRSWPLGDALDTE